jgi:hypothetical protein
VSSVKSAELIWQLGHCRYPPLRLLLGSYAVESIRDRLRCVIEEVCTTFRTGMEGGRGEGKRECGWADEMQIEDWKHLSFPVTDDGEDEKGGEEGRMERGEEEEGEEGLDEE